MFYISKRVNPQLPRPYYSALGKLTKKEAKKKEQCLYGSKYLTGYKTEKEYIDTLSELFRSGVQFQ